MNIGCKTPVNTKKAKCGDLPERREAMTRGTWIKNVLRIYPEKTHKEAEELYNKLFLKA